MRTIWKSISMRIEPRRHPKKSSVYVFLDKRAIPAKGSEQAIDSRRAG
jgi:hypothetical protein